MTEHFTTIKRYAPGHPNATPHGSIRDYRLFAAAQRNLSHLQATIQQGVQLDVQDILDKVQQKMFTDYVDKTIFDNFGLKDIRIILSPGVTDSMRGKPRKEEDANSELIKLQHQFLKEMFCIDWSLPMTQNQQIAYAFLQENKSEFLLGVEDAETSFRRSYEMRQWRGDISKEIAKVWLDDNKGVVCARFPYNVKVIDEIRAQIPKGKKSWNPDNKVWEFSVEAIDTIVKILQSYFDDVIDLTQATPPLPPTSISADPLLSLLDEDDIKKIRQMLSKKYHPDLGGDAAKMAKINQVFNKK